MQEKMAAGEIPPACTGCREVLTAGSLPMPRLAAVARSATDVTDTGDAVPELSIITTCKGRLAHLKQTLPAMVAQADTEVIVVDYACPEGTADWVAATFPQVRVVRIERAPFFNVARARNSGAAQAHGRWLCFVDADILLAADFAVRVRPLLQNDAFHVFANPQPAVLGAVVCRPADFTAIGGYDDVIEGYGTEDRDLYLRLLAHGRRSEQLPGDIVQALSHDRAASVRYYELKDHTLSQRINATYVQIKQDLARQFGAHFLGVDTRRTIYAEVGRAFRQAAASGRPATRVEITLPAALDVRLFDWQMTRVWTYLLNPLPPPLRVPEE
jgi:glycosyltransferase involved in cell wall biosynthesis